MLKKYISNCKYCNSKFTNNITSYNNLKDGLRGLSSYLSKKVIYAKCKNCHSLSILHPEYEDIRYDEGIYSKSSLYYSSNIKYPYSFNLPLYISKLTLSKNKNILEIGPGEGIMVKELTNLKFKVSVIEPDMGFHNKLLNCGALKIYNDVSEIEKEKKFDLIIAIALIEHIKDLRL